MEHGGRTLSGGFVRVVDAVFLQFYAPRRPLGASRRLKLHLRYSVRPTYQPLASGVMEEP